MDSNISDLLGGILSNPDMMSKVTTLLPLVSQMMKSDEPQSADATAATSALNPPQQTVISQPSAVTSEVSSNPLENENVATAIQNLIVALSDTSSQNQQAKAAMAVQQSEPVTASTAEPPPTPTTAANPLDALGSVGANADAATSINIEKTLSTLKNVTAVASPENDHRAKLLLSLKPFLNNSRKVKIDTAIKYINAAKILTSLGKNGFV